MKRPRCKTCPHFDRGPDGGTASGRDGYCLRFPRSPVPNPDGKFSLVVWCFAEVDAEDGCGEHTDFPAYLADRELAGGGGPG